MYLCEMLWLIYATQCSEAYPTFLCTRRKSALLRFNKHHSRYICGRSFIRIELRFGSHDCTSLSGLLKFCSLGWSMIIEIPLQACLDCDDSKAPPCTPQVYAALWRLALHCGEFHEMAAERQRDVVVTSEMVYRYRARTADCHADKILAS